tara:strand:+ start:707 stop:949 length:243 start_codon:yes stop_codon:yes gene_type:complete
MKTIVITTINELTEALKKFVANSWARSVYQKRKPQDLIKNLKDEIIGYEFNISILDDINKILDFLPEKSYEVYKSCRGHF